MKKIVTLIGTRPEIIKMSPIIPLLDEHFDSILVHSGQHYSSNLDKIFFKELNLKKPDFSIDVGSHPPGSQTAKILTSFEKLLFDLSPDAVIVHGDTNTTLAGALAVAKLKNSGMKLIHIEACVRSFDENQAEEINRKLVDQVSDLLFAPFENDKLNGEREGINGSKIFVTNGNSVVESSLRTAKLLNDKEVCESYRVNIGEFAIATFHRQETVDDAASLKNVCDAINQISTKIPVIIPLHPRTSKMIEQYNLELTGENVRIFDPIGYKDMIGLLKNCRFCMTDSGGIQEEAAVLNIPALILRLKTEHIRYIESGMHLLVGTDKNTIIEEALKIIDDESEYAMRKTVKNSIPTNVSLKIIEEIKRFLN